MKLPPAYTKGVFFLRFVWSEIPPKHSPPFRFSPELRRHLPLAFIHGRSVAVVSCLCRYHHYRTAA
jgi:hypothetical protein